MLDDHGARPCTGPGRAAPHQRTRGRAYASFDLRDGAVVLGNLHQSGSAKAMLPRTHRARPELVFLNTAGGLTGGDHLRFELEVGEGAAVTATTQTAERAYASLGDPARLDVTLRVGAGGGLHWLPQETIVFERAHLARRTVVDLSGDARLVMAETLVLGRAAMGEQLHDVTVRDWREVRRDGRPIFLEPLCLTAESLARRSGAAVLGAGLALSTICVAGPGAEDALTALRARLAEAGPEIEAAASGWDGKLVMRALSQDAFTLRRLVAECLHLLCAGPLPRVWQL
ncbi:urease accessory protein UreD [Pseudoruegeria sp. SK021]|uniref:urease accessory protein UreD n=1 Tax=Pseudoruegeria sp. SK021 TaxID=1933035 RepID=UPI000A22A8E8|nr:urease accessory protein UreD [Pseudoruegeria sp. SK021]OSP56356.1 hypothetical protein BV911_03470 [Pseudoruegeria sp. SK021]